ncbi:MAG: SIS domain-containing protein [Candidatus Omnitrophica bacterium]|jgi:D-sedoheptulose 7-phosphate isomerase|nr:SIS domain-containing protein [Candidatus Omnitrophota bacterium]
MSKDYIDIYFAETKNIIDSINREDILKVSAVISDLRNTAGRLFILGIGGSAANASHAVNDFRKIARIEAYAASDNVSELTAWTNDSGFEYIFIEWLKVSKLTENDVLLVLSVGGGTKTVSQNLVLAMRYAKEKNARVVSIVSRDGGEARKISDACILIPVIDQKRVTPHAEGFQAVLLHLIVNNIST